jgi:hypothetical protein
VRARDLGLEMAGSYLLRKLAPPFFFLHLFSELTLNLYLLHKEKYYLVYIYSTVIQLKLRGSKNKL